MGPLRVQSVLPTVGVVGVVVVVVVVVEVTPRYLYNKKIKKITSVLRKKASKYDLCVSRTV